MKRRSDARSHRRLQWTVGLLALAPTISGALIVLRGADGTPGHSPGVSPTIDGELRYANVFKSITGPVIVTQLGEVEDSRVLTAALGTVLAGGLARLLSWQQTGRPHNAAFVAIALEVCVVPAVVMWRHRLASGRG
ncbi:DUF4345 domain-containing protein [Rhodococcoides fascians]|uniref:DUF4345 domain-containing protein n=1 Tax=Rhodococcoides fascians TaxID=1828 RepID=UPI0009B865F6|nr:DUF4345 domain-containing protein [Rhodococcus fascians]